MTCFGVLAILLIIMVTSQSLPLNSTPNSPVMPRTFPATPTSASAGSQLTARTILAQIPDANVTPGLLYREYFDTLFKTYGPQRWWPGRSRFEVIVGAVLTQNTSWTNVERAIRNLRAGHLLSPQALRLASSARVARLIRPSGYFRQKTKTLKAFGTFLHREYRGSLNRMFAAPTTQLRSQLLAVRGIGPETADSILLYAGKHPVFVIDAYTRRILERHHLAHTGNSYEELRQLLESSLPTNHQLFNEFHALIVHVGKNFCRPKDPRCSQCPLARFLPQSNQSAQ